MKIRQLINSYKDTVSHVKVEDIIREYNRLHTRATKERDRLYNKGLINLTVEESLEYKQLMEIIEKSCSTKGNQKTIAQE